MSEENKKELNDSDEILAEMKRSKLTPKSFDPKEVNVETKNTQMITLINRIENGEIVLNPEFQRSADVWGDDQQSRLIESMILNIPIPAFYIDASDDDKWVIIDGLQRLNAIKRFVIDKTLRLIGLTIKTDYETRRFLELPPTDQRRIKETDIVLYQIKRGTPDVVRYEIFNRINTGGTKLSHQEIRTALHLGPFVAFLERLAGTKRYIRGRANEGREFITATCESVSSDRKNDQEYVLRFMAFNFLPPEYYRAFDARDWDLFLHKAMDVGNRLSEQKLTEYEALFTRAMQVSHIIFQDEAFRKVDAETKRRGPVNKSLFEAVSVNIARLTYEQQELLIKKRARVVEGMRKLLAKNSPFNDAISQGTSSVNKVRYRFAAVKKMFEEILSSND